MIPGKPPLPDTRVRRRPAPAAGPGGTPSGAKHPAQSRPGADSLRGLERQHRVLEEVFEHHQIALLERRWDDAVRLLREYAAGLLRHIEFEERHVLPRSESLGERQWSDAVYRAEHRRIEALLRNTEERLRRACPARMTPCVLIGLLDAERTLKHLVQHHHEREERALFTELRRVGGLVGAAGTQSCARTTAGSGA